MSLILINGGFELISNGTARFPTWRGHVFWSSDEVRIAH